MKILDIRIREREDSRGAPTIVVFVTTKGGAGEASIPSGKSTGMREAKTLAPKDAVNAGAQIAAALAGHDFSNNRALDKTLIALDGTPLKKNLGGNVMLGVSLAFARVRAAAEGKALWEILRAEYFPDLAATPIPRIFANLVNGGVHAKSNLSLQEYLVVAKPYLSVSDVIAGLKKLYAILGKMLAEKFPSASVGIGDEGGYVADFRDDREPLEILTKLLRVSHSDDSWFLGLDAAASTFFKNGSYRLGNETLTAAELATRYASYAKTVPLLKTIEDPFAEDSLDDFAAFQKAHPELRLIGDDLTVSNAAAITAATARGAIKGVIVKPNQAGTVTETCDAITAATAHGLDVIVSHRSGETPDPFLVHFAKAGNVYGVKIGAPIAHRLPRYEELVRIYDTC
ncbi:MAG: hypothetical protein HYU81_00105 [Candidatus Brennerbacteria bacterium]|nr:hypothetical protein [Candidatus Brennerbacteria bacterium]